MNAFIASCTMFLNMIAQVLSLYYITKNDDTVKEANIDSWILPMIGVCAMTFQYISFMLVILRCTSCKYNSKISAIFSGSSLICTIAYFIMVLYVYIEWNNVLSGNVVGIKINACSTTDMCTNAETSMIMSALCAILNLISFYMVLRIEPELEHYSLM